MLCLNIFLDEIEKLKSGSATQSYLLATSGGADSMVMMDLFIKAKFKFQVAHINYKLREEASDLDQKLVEDVCKAHQIPIYIYQVSEIDTVPKNSVQNWARKLRYQYFTQIQKQENLEFLITAHHLNDDLETFLIHISRGSGLRGLSGIPASKNNILRPLLRFSKAEIYRYAKENKVSFREDASNKKSDYLRNKIRNEIVPKLEETTENFLKNFRKSLDLLQQNETFVREQITILEHQLLIEESPDQKVYNKNKFDEQDDFVKFEILRKFGFNDPREIKKVFYAETGKIFYSKKYQLHINRDELILITNENIGSEPTAITLLEKWEEEKSKTIDLAKIILAYTSSNSKSPLSLKKSWEFDAESLTFPLKLRHRKEGDFFYPVHMTGRKKISKFYKDEKFSVLDKQQIWLLIDGNDEILGIVPHRQDRRFISSKNTRYTITIEF